MKRAIRSVEVEPLNPDRKPGEQLIYKIKFFEYELWLSHWPSDANSLSMFISNWIENGNRPK